MLAKFEGNQPFLEYLEALRDCSSGAGRLWQERNCGCFNCTLMAMFFLEVELRASFLAEAVAEVDHDFIDGPRAPHVN